MGRQPLLRLLPPVGETDAGARDPAHWRACWRTGDATSPQLGCGSLRDAAAAMRGQSPVVYVPGETVLLTRVTLPRGRRAQLLAALPYALEDRLIDDVERLHCALGPALGDGQWLAAVTDRDNMTTWLAVLDAAGITPESLLPDTLLATRPDDGWSVVCDDGRVYVRQAENAGFVCHATLLPLVLARSLKQHACPARVHLHGCDTIPALAEQCPESHLETVTAAERDNGVLDTLLLQAVPTELNLLQGPYSPRSQMLGVLRPWFPVAAMLGLILSLGLIDRVLEYRRLHERQAALDARMVQLFRETFPEARRVVNPRTQMRHRLSALQGGASPDRGDFLRLLARLAPVMKQQPKAKITYLRFAGGRLEIRLSTPDLQSLDKLREALAAAVEGSVELKSANADNNRVDGRIVIGP